MGRTLQVVAVGIFALALTGCASHYTRHMSETFKEAPVAAKTFAILPVMDITYQPPSNCMGSGSGSGSEYQKPWLESMEKDLRTRFKTQAFKSYSADQLEELKIDVPALYSVATDEISSMGVTKLEASPNGPPKLIYETARVGGKVGRYLRALHDSDKVDYVIMLVEPKMVGETHTNFNAQGGVTTSTVYTSDVQFGVWSAETGELAYSSGAISASSGFCFFISPQQLSINGTTGDIATQLKALIALLLKEKAARPLELGMSAAGRP